ncbi:hypothetical protein PR048_032095 [Dryococelus australis]|uniref:Uncharacterized protein n=1 Tax=Dryococelus australis TaxID=614101 RepID=A0ABQ9G2F7_9NEOP|nr:hypothetical protein PR048_032095 [Dryococelus australis]
MSSLKDMCIVTEGKSPTVTYLLCTVKANDGNTAHLVRRSDEALEVHVSVALIAPSLLYARLLSPLHTEATAVCSLAVAPHLAVVEFARCFLASLLLAQESGRAGPKICDQIAKKTLTGADTLLAVLMLWRVVVDDEYVAWRLATSSRQFTACPVLPQPLIGRFSRGSSVYPALIFCWCSILTSITLIGSQDLVDKIRPNLSTPNSSNEGGHVSIGVMLGWVHSPVPWLTDLELGPAILPFENIWMPLTSAVTSMYTINGHLGSCDMRVSVLVLAAQDAVNGSHIWLATASCVIGWDAGWRLSYPTLIGEQRVTPSWQRVRGWRSGRGGTVVRLLTSHLGGTGSIHGADTSGCLHAGFVPDDAVGRCVFSGISRFLPLLPPRSGILASGTNPYSPRFTLTDSQVLDLLRAKNDLGSVYPSETEKLSDLRTTNHRRALPPICHRRATLFPLPGEVAGHCQRLEKIDGCVFHANSVATPTLQSASMATPLTDGALNLLASDQGDSDSIPSSRYSRMWESCRVMSFVGGFSRGSPVFPAPSIRRHSIFTSITLIGSQDLVKSRPNLFTHSLTVSPKQARKGYAFVCTIYTYVYWAAVAKPEQTGDRDSHESARMTTRRRARTQLTSLSAGPPWHPTVEWPRPRTLRLPAPSLYVLFYIVPLIFSTRPPFCSNLSIVQDIEVPLLDTQAFLSRIHMMLLVRLLESHQGEAGSIPGRVTPGFSQVVIVPDNAAGRRVFSGISLFPCPCIHALLPTRLTSPSLALKTSLKYDAASVTLAYTSKLFGLLAPDCWSGVAGGFCNWLRTAISAMSGRNPARVLGVVLSLSFRR